MYITITIKTQEQAYNISVDNRQTICAAEEILRDSGRYNGDSPDFYRSLLQSKIISRYLSFEDAGIISGDVLSQV